MWWSVLSAIGIWFGVHWGYVLLMAAKAARNSGRLTPYWMVMLWPAVPIVGVLDFVFQFTFGFMFLERQLHGVFFSHRVQWHIDNSEGWRYVLAKFWMRQLNVFDDHIRPRISPFVSGPISFGAFVPTEPGSSTRE